MLEIDAVALLNAIYNNLSDKQAEDFLNELDLDLDDLLDEIDIDELDHNIKDKFISFSISNAGNIDIVMDLFEDFDIDDIELSEATISKLNMIASKEESSDRIKEILTSKLVIWSGNNTPFNYSNSMPSNYYNCEGIIFNMSGLSYDISDDSILSIKTIKALVTKYVELNHFYGVVSAGDFIYAESISDIISYLSYSDFNFSYKSGWKDWMNDYLTKEMEDWFDENDNEPLTMSQQVDFAKKFMDIKRL